jgi:hypothetical protein
MSASFSTCQQMRRKLVKHGMVNLGTGALTPVKEEWVDGICDTPLFGSHPKFCRGCLEGWTHEHNYALNTEAEEAGRSARAPLDERRAS